MDEMNKQIGESEKEKIEPKKVEPKKIEPKKIKSNQRLTFKPGINHATSFFTLSTLFFILNIINPPNLKVLHYCN